MSTTETIVHRGRHAAPGRSQKRRDALALLAATVQINQRYERLMPTANVPLMIAATRQIEAEWALRDALDELRNECAPRHVVWRGATPIPAVLGGGA